MGDSIYTNIKIGDKVVRNIEKPTVEMIRWFYGIVYGIVTSVDDYPKTRRKKVCVVWYNHKGMHVKEFIYNMYEDSKLFKVYEEGGR